MYHNVMSSKTLTCNTVIIGAGSAGLCAYRELSRHDDSCIIVESGPLGTFVQRSGDIPANILMSTALEVNALGKLDKFGVRVRGERSVDTSMVMNALRAVRARGTNEVLTYLYRIDEHRRIIGRASFVDANTLQVGEDITIQFKTAIIATGSTPAVPYDLANLGDVMTVSDIFEMDNLPKSLAVFGTNENGLMIGQALAYLGVQVVVFASSGIWELTDDTVINTARDAFQRNFNLEADARITEIEKNEEGYGIYYLDGDDFENYIHIDNILSSYAMAASTDGLNLKEVGIELTDSGMIEVNDNTMQTSVPNIFAVGDVVNEYNSIAKGINDAIIATANARNFPNVVSNQRRDIRISVLHSDPPLAIVGKSFSEMKERARGGMSFIACDGRMSEGLYRARRKDGGIIRMYTDEKTHLVLGAEICGYGADNIAQFLAQSILDHKSIYDLENFVFFRPSYEEIVSKVVDATLRVIRRKGAASYE